MRHNKRSAFTIVLPALLLSLGGAISSCGFRVEKANPRGGAPGEQSPDTSLTPQFSIIREKIFKKYNCLKCHSAGGNASSRPLSTRADLLDEVNGLVTPGSPEESWLVLTLEHKTTKPMPPDGKILDDELSTIKTWIANGAPDN